MKNEKLEWQPTAIGCNLLDGFVDFTLFRTQGWM
jgi:hypothetical protein